MLTLSRDQEQRALLLEILRDNDAIDRPLTFEGVQRTMDTLGQSVSANDLRKLLRYLEGRGLVCLTLRSALGGVRHRHEKSDDIVLVRLTPNGLDQAGAQ